LQPSMHEFPFFLLQACMYDQNVISFVLLHLANIYRRILIFIYPSLHFIRAAKSRMNGWGYGSNEKWIQKSNQNGTKEPYGRRRRWW
jgi:hypothetical protein